MAGHSVSPAAAMRELRRSKSGGKFSDGITDFEWGNIETLLAGKLHSRARVARVTDAPRYVYHLDRLPKSRRESIERTHAIPNGAISGNLTDSKADVLIVDSSGRTYMVSFKEIEGQTKLGQVSADTVYGSAKLNGGLDDLDISSLPIPSEISAKDTALSAGSFRKATDKDKKLAYYKKQHTVRWNSYVDKKSMAARRSLEECASVLCADRISFIEFVGKVLGGSSRQSRDFYVALGDKLIHLQTILEKLSDRRWQVSTRDSSTTAKHAILLTVSDGARSYGLTRIEQSFEGAKPNVIQTKGIVFHFQQHPRHGMNYKRLLLDLR